MWEWNDGDSYRSCTHSRSPRRSPGLLPLPRTRHRTTARAGGSAWRQSGMRTPRASSGSCAPSRRASQTPPCCTQPQAPSQGPSYPRRWPPRWTSPSENRSSRSSIAARSGEGASTGLKHHCPPNPPALSGFPCHREAHLPLCPLPCQRHPPASSAQPHGALISPPSLPLSGFQVLSLLPLTAPVHTHCQRRPGSGQSVQPGLAGKRRSFWPRRNQVHTWVLGVLRGWTRPTVLVAFPAAPCPAAATPSPSQWSSPTLILYLPLFFPLDPAPPTTPLLTSLPSPTLSLPSVLLKPASEITGHPESCCTTTTTGSSRGHAGSLLIRKGPCAQLPPSAQLPLLKMSPGWACPDSGETGNSHLSGMSGSGGNTQGPWVPHPN